MLAARNVPAWVRELTITDAQSVVPGSVPGARDMVAGESKGPALRAFAV